MPNRRLLAVIVAASAALFLLPASASALKMVPGVGGTSVQVGSVTDVATADFDNDGESDAVVSTGNATPLDGIHVLISNGDGSYVESPLAQGNPGYYSVYTGDFDGDGDQDILGKPYSSGVMNMFLGQGDGGFDPAIGFFPPRTPYRFNSLAVGNLNNDAMDDIVIGSGSGQYVIGLASGGGNFNFTTGIVAAGHVMSVAIGNFNGLGYNDIALGDDAGAINVLVGVGNGSPSAWPDNPIPTAGDLPIVGSIATGDFNGDGSDDLGASVSQTLGSLIGSVQTFLGDDGGLVANPSPTGAVFSPPTVVPGDPGPYGYAELVSTDFNQDGSDDLGYLLTVGGPTPNPYQAGIRLSGGDGSFSEAPGSPFAFSWSSNMWALAVGDFDEDEAPDLIGGSAYGGGAAPVLLNAPDVTTDVDSISFNEHKVGTSVTRAVELINQGGPGVTITGITLDGPDASQYSLTAASLDCVAALPPADSCPLEVTFSPTSEGVKTGQLEIEYAESETPIVVGLFGEGVVSEASVSPENLEFGEMRINTTDTETVTVTSSGEATLSLDQLSLAGDDAGRFSLSDDGCSNTDLEPTQTCTVKVTASPTAVGDLEATLEIPNDGDGASEVPIAATGINPGISVTPATYDFGKAEIDGVGQGNEFTVTSTGTTPAEFSHVSISGADADDFSVSSDDCGDPIPPGATCTFFAAFSPGEGPEGSRSATLNVISNAPPAEVMVSGTATIGDVSISPNPLAFGDVKSGASATEVLTLSAEGTADLYVRDLELSGPDEDKFEISSDQCSNAQTPSGDSCEVELTFTPDGTGAKATTLTVDTFTQVQEVDLTGAGIDPAGTLTPASHDFGSAEIGVASGHPSQVFTLTSTGTTPLKVTTFFNGGVDDTFTIAGADTCAGQELNPGTSCQVTVSFDPKSGEPGERSGQISFATNAGTKEAGYKGTATRLPVPPGPVRSASLKLRSAGKVKRGKRLAVTATIVNTGETAISGIALKTAVGKKFAKAPKTVKVSSLAIGATVKRTIKIAVKKKAKAGKKIKVTVTATAGGTKLATAKRAARIKK